MKIAIALAALVVGASLTGCKTIGEQEAQQEAQQDDATCRGYGAKAGTDAYINCRSMAVANRNSANLAGIQQSAAARQAAWDVYNSMRRTY
ncbi:hypothetical protein QD460_25980 [Rhizobium jaguaris]|uniref:hypothetical protein n=1 Tax=Rhizobium jaguaris TaxID=1312183 RepID=UPI0039BFFCF4